MKTSAPYKELGSNVGQQTMRVLDRNWKSFFQAIKSWHSSPSKFLGKPNLPSYLPKDGRFVLIADANKFDIRDGYIRFIWKPLRSLNGKFKTKTTGRPIQIRFVPRRDVYVLEFVYEIEVPEPMEKSNRIIGVDIGVNNLATVGNNARLQSFIIIDDYMHKSSRYIIDYCIDNLIDTIVIGKNDGWKQKCRLGKANQNFIQIPFESLIQKIQYKAENVGIKVILTEESYTSGTSFIDRESPSKSNYNKNRRLKRGLFKSNDGKLINADLNASYQIIKKVLPKEFEDGIEGVGLHPIRVNI